MKNFILATLLLITAVLAWQFVGKPNNDRYNAHMCAVYGYYPDCKTPLPAELKLK